MPDGNIRVPQDSVRALLLLPTPLPSSCNGNAAQALYPRGSLSSGKAADLAGVNGWEWEELSRHYSDEDLNRDNSYAAWGK